MIDAILLDGTANPVCVRLNSEHANEFKSARKRSMTWAGSAEAWRRDSENPPKYFNFTKVIERKERRFENGEEKDRIVGEVLVFTMSGVRSDQLVPGLRMKGLDLDAEDAPVTIEVQGQLLAEQFLYPEKYALMGRIEVAA